MDQTLSYVMLGKGSPIILLHGLALDHTIWNPVADLLKDDFLLILPDLRGHGIFFSPPGEYSMGQMAEDVLRLMDQLDLEKAFIGGHSMGGYVALNFAKNYSERISGLALIASHIYSDSPKKRDQRLDQIKELAHGSPVKIFKEMLEGLTREKKVKQYCKEIVKTCDPKSMQGVLYAMANREASREIDKTLDRPVLIIAGTEDQFIPLETSREMAEELRTPYLFEVENAGHMVMMERPYETAHAIRKYLLSER